MHNKLIIFILLFSFLNCSKKSPLSESRNTEKKPAFHRGEIIDAQTFHQIIKSNKGKVIIVSFWATWCPSCFQDLSLLSNLKLEYGKKEVQVILISTDKKDHNKKVKKLYEYFNGDFLALQSTESSEFMKIIDKKWHGTIPTTYIMDRTGKVIKKVVGSKKIQKIKSQVEKALLGLPRLSGQ